LSTRTASPVTIDVDTAATRFVCRAGEKEQRSRLLRLIQHLGPEKRPQVQDGLLLLHWTTAVALRERGEREHVVWSELAARCVDQLTYGLKNLPAAKKRLAELQAQVAADSVLADYDLARNLDPHQRIAVAVMTDPLILGLCLFDEQGSGKTVMAVHGFDRLKKMGIADALLILAPKNMLGEWEKDIRRFTGDSYAV
jgi:SNF2 family DNA or RNA helicase